MTDNDADEHLFVDVFLKAISLEYQFEKQNAGGGPDFVLSNPESQVRLEVTRVYREPEPGQIPRRQMEGIRDSLMQHAKREWDARGLPPLEVHCHYNDHHTPFVSEAPRVAHELVEVVHAALPEVGSSANIDRDYKGPLELPRAVHSVSIVRLKGHDRSYWFGGDAAWGVELSSSRVQERIDAKNAKFERYRRPDREAWLLVVMDSRRFSGMMKVGLEATEYEYCSSFARTYLLDLLYARAWQLRTRIPGAGLNSPGHR